MSLCGHLVRYMVTILSGSVARQAENTLAKIKCYLLDKSDDGNKENFSYLRNLSANLRDFGQ